MQINNLKMFMSDLHFKLYVLFVNMSDLYSKVFFLVFQLLVN